ncbi:cytochrome c oxidase subunit 3 [Haloechinothrix sp. YIM 98757]|uniref:Cytochrome aa3 subunit 3 n=1 Tax=Haloechinothrix aidingensis TaxID=2752311 RepID=A0A838AC65_9PSEU|nr:cytochrome c oxidase subunit 3 [Haloechinothrix aidingensis]MBA0126846.1 cytochrome c oxidase subunit 3 [Haloechinothrix aidingensis]
MVDHLGRHGSIARSAEHVPAERGMWLFLLADMTVFALFFGAYLWEFGSARHEFTADAAALPVPVGFVNTLVLLTSSFLVVRAVEAHRSGAFGRARRFLGGTLAGAGTFAGLKLVEYALEIAAGHGLTTSPFFMYYFVITGVHLMHVAIGTTLLVAWRRALAPGKAPYGPRWAEGVAGYWHMVDLLWLIIFSLLYIGSYA